MQQRMVHGSAGSSSGRSWPSALRLTLVLLAAQLAWASPAFATGYTLTHIVIASQKHLPAETILAMASAPETPWSVDGETAIRLLRSGVSPVVIQALTGGAHPTAAEIEASKTAGPAWAPAAPEPNALAPMIDHRVEIERSGGTSVEGELVAITETSAVVSMDSGAVVIVPRGEIQSVYLMDRRVSAGPGTPGEPSASADDTDPAAPAELTAAAAPRPPQLPASDDRDATEPDERAAGRRLGARPITSLHTAEFHSANQMTFAGIGETVAGLALLAAIAPSANGGAKGLRSVAFGLTALGTGTVVAGSLLGEQALARDGYRVSPASGWIGAGTWVTGMAVYAVTFSIADGPEPSPGGAVLLSSGCALGLIQAGVNAGRRHHQLEDADRVGFMVTPLYDGTHTGLVFTTGR